MERFYSNGKLLLTGEYLVLDGALSLAIPTKYGQSLNIEAIEASKLVWKSLDEKENIWFKDEFLIGETIKSRSVDSSNDINERLIQILNIAKKLNPNFLNTENGFKVTTRLDFPRQWGLGTSSTLINNIAQWANVDPYQLLKQSFDGSGYDIACAKHSLPITYQLFVKTNEVSCDTQNNTRAIKEIAFNPSFKDHLYFVYLNQKQNSRDGIARYKNNISDLSEYISTISTITQNIILCKTLDEFILLIEKHEYIISKIIHQDPIKKRLFSDFNGGIKSLGAWGGDFVLAASKNNPTDYFKKKGYQTVISFENMIL